MSSRRQTRTTSGLAGLLKPKFHLTRHVSTRHNTFDVSTPCILAVSSLSNSRRHDELDISAVTHRTCQDEPSGIWALLDNLPINQLAISQVANWSTCGLVNLPTAIFLKSRKNHTIVTLNLNITLTLTVSTTESVQLCNLLQINFIVIIYCKFIS